MKVCNLKSLSLLGLILLSCCSLLFSVLFFTEGKVVKIARESIHVVVLGFSASVITEEEIRDEFKFKIVGNINALSFPPTDKDLLLTCWSFCCRKMGKKYIAAHHIRGM